MTRRAAIQAPPPYDPRLVPRCPPDLEETTPPVSRAFIEQRADIDEPQIGYMIRAKETGWLQGFAWYTTFTHWTHFFRWDSLAAQAGIRRMAASDSTRKLDANGELSTELDAQPREGDPMVNGVVWPTVAEIAVVGGLGCGGFLLGLLLEELEQKEQYKYVVLQATNNSIPFYERFGFVRVGAVARYSKRKTGLGGGEIVGYRHWLATDEELHPSDKPSYMMARRLKRHPTTRSGARNDPTASFLRAPLTTLLPQYLCKRVPVVQHTKVPPDLLAVSAAIDALSRGDPDEAERILAESPLPPPWGGKKFKPQQPPPQPKRAAGRTPVSTGRGRKGRAGRRRRARRRGSDDDDDDDDDEDDDDDLLDDEYDEVYVPSHRGTRTRGPSASRRSASPRRGPSAEPQRAAPTAGGRGRNGTVAATAVEPAAARQAAASPPPAQQAKAAAGAGAAAGAAAAAAGGGLAGRPRDALGRILSNSQIAKMEVAKAAKAKSPAGAAAEAKAAGRPPKAQGRAQAGDPVVREAQELAAREAAPAAAGAGGGRRGAAAAAAAAAVSPASGSGRRLREQSPAPAGAPRSAGPSAKRAAAAARDGGSSEDDDMLVDGPAVPARGGAKRRLEATPGRGRNGKRQKTVRYADDDDEEEEEEEEMGGGRAAGNARGLGEPSSAARARHLQLEQQRERERLRKLAEKMLAAKQSGEGLVPEEGVRLTRGQRLQQQQEQALLLQIAPGLRAAALGKAAPHAPALALSPLGAAAAGKKPAAAAAAAARPQSPAAGGKGRGPASPAEAAAAEPGATLSAKGGHGTWKIKSPAPQAKAPAPPAAVRSPPSGGGKGAAAARSPPPRFKGAAAAAAASPPGSEPRVTRSGVKVNGKKVGRGKL